MASSYSKRFGTSSVHPPKGAPRQQRGRQSRLVRGPRGEIRPLKMKINTSPMDLLTRLATTEAIAPHLSPGQIVTL